MNPTHTCGLGKPTRRSLGSGRGTGYGAVTALYGLALGAGCATAGSSWMEQPLPGSDQPLLATSNTPELAPAPRGKPGAVRARTLGEAPVEARATAPEGSVQVNAGAGAGGRSLGTFRNTYYDFPSEADYEGASLSLMSSRCSAIASVPQAFFEALCVQGSGTLRKGSTVSFARRDCECAPVCPKTNQKICFDELDAKDYPWGRGAMGKAITPLLTVAVDPAVIPLGTALYIPDLAGMPRDPEGTVAHDGCFIAQDRGLAVTGNHVDVFTGHRSITTLWNRRVPSNRGVTVILDSPRCARSAR